MAVSADQLCARLRAGPLVLDGATGTELERRGVSAELPLWSAGALLTAPEVVEAVHRDYVLAGAQIIVANTFRTNPRTVRAAGCFERGRELNRLAVALARRAAGDRGVLVAASVAPVEDCYCPERVPPDAELWDEHRQMVTWVADAAPDLVWIETMNTGREARIAAAAAAEAGLPFVVSFVVTESGELLSGEPLEKAVAAVSAFGPVAVGLNCIPPRGLGALLPRLRRATDLPLVAYAHIANAVPIRGWSYSQDTDPAEYADYARSWVAGGAAVVGGCCGTTPDHIEAVAAAVRAGDRGFGGADG